MIDFYFSIYLSGCWCAKSTVDRFASALAGDTGLTAISVTGDGNCLFHAISQFLQGTVKTK